MFFAKHRPSLAAALASCLTILIFVSGLAQRTMAHHSFEGGTDFSLDCWGYFATSSFLPFHDSTAHSPAPTVRLDVTDIHFQNPVRDQLEISGLPDDAGPAVEVQLFSLLGQPLLKFQSRTSDVSHDVSVLEPGTYIARLTRSGKILATRRILKRE